MDNDIQFTEEIERLVSGEIESIEIDEQHFLNFREAWHQHPEKDNIVGHAHHHGKVTYYYEPNHSEVDE